MRKWLNRLPANPSTIAGRMLGIATVASLLAVVDSSLIPLLSQLLWLSIIAFISGLLFRPKLQIRIDPSHLLVNGQSMSLEVTVTNTGALAAYDLQIGFLYSEFGLQVDRQPQGVDALGAGEQAVLRYKLQATARGEHQLPPLEIASLFPFGMFRFTEKRIIEETILVAPKYETIALEELPGHKSDLTLSDWAKRSHRSVEYVGSREFREGLQVRRWDFAAWARLGVPTIREFNEANAPSAMIVVDAFRNPHGHVDDKLEILLSRAATIASALDRSGFQITLVIVEDCVEILHGQIDRDQLSSLLRRLAKANVARKQEPWETTWELIETTLQSDWILHCCLRSDRPMGYSALTEGAELFGAMIDWTPSIEIQGPTK